MRSWSVDLSPSLDFGTDRQLQPPPPASLGSILDSFRRSGEGDRELLLSILGAKKAEEEVCFLRLAKPFGISAHEERPSASPPSSKPA